MVKLRKEEIEFIKGHINDAEKLLNSNDPNELIEALHDFTVEYLMQDIVNDKVRTAERIIDRIVYEE
ncbi:MAG: hypothetical protein KHZ85_00545 [Amedibacillus dolichus]|jgi:hypothetical protein|uniref:Uncharacterized protein n=1 Tax=Amedibacillus dolichus TaxID=31971 RepID=A0A942W7G4_9FIRM|nr:hypothetical protein [Amedibacillus dolichus]MBS4883249.1 hypothetical protein [Amedibacillus dolichus]